MKKIFAGALLAAASVLGLTLVGSSAEAQIKPVPPYTITPTFNCSVSPNAAHAVVAVVKANAAPTAGHAIAVSIHTPAGLVKRTLCGTQFTSANVGTTVTTTVPVTAADAKDKQFIWTCSASYESGTPCP